MNPLPAKNIILSLTTLFMTTTVMGQSAFDLQGHRGCRGLMPENTFPGFIQAVELGVTTLELDVVVSADSQIVISHEPWMSAEICSHPDGRPVTKKEEKSLNLYQMEYREIQTYDCGLRFVERFPRQKKINAVKPTLKMVVRMVRGFAEDNKYPQPRFNIELKSDPKLYDTYQPQPAQFVAMVTIEIQRLGIADITTLQSFDIAVLEELNKIEGRAFAISYLVEKGKKVQKNLSKLSFVPEVYSPLYTLVTEAAVRECHDQGMKVIPWTINDAADMERLRAWGCDGGITDYPDVVR